MHQAKGLEFDAVFVIMLCDGLFPGSRSLDSPDALEEERRLFYVATTRARDELYLSYPLIRTLQGAGAIEPGLASRWWSRRRVRFVVPLQGGIFRYSGGFLLLPPDRGSIQV